MTEYRNPRYYGKNNTNNTEQMVRMKILESKGAYPELLQDF